MKLNEQYSKRIFSYNYFEKIKKFVSELDELSVIKLKEYHKVLNTMFKLDQYKNMKVFIKGFQEKNTLDLIICALLNDINIEVHNTYTDDINFEENTICLIHANLWKAIIKETDSCIEKMKKKPIDFIVALENPLLNLHLKKFKEKGFNQHGIYFSYIINDSNILTAYEVTKNDYEISGLRILPLGRALNEDCLFILNHKLKPTLIGATGDLYYKEAPIVDIEGNKNVLDFIGKEEKSDLYNTKLKGFYLPGKRIQITQLLKNTVTVNGKVLDLILMKELIQLFDGTKNVYLKYDQKSDKISAYVLLYDNKLYKKSHLQLFLEENSPLEMIPDHIVLVDATFIDKDGGINSEAIEGIESSLETQEEIQEDLYEAKLLEIFKKDLKNKKIRVTDNIFDLGYSSLKAIQILSLINHEFKVNIEIQMIFKLNTIQELARELKKADQLYYEPIIPIEKAEYYDVSGSQKRLWILSQFEKGSIAYNEHFAFKIDGYMDVDVLKEAINSLLIRHESLRTVFVQIEGELKQKIIMKLPVEKVFYYEDISQENNPLEMFNEIINQKKNETFNLLDGPLIKISLYETNKNQYMMNLCMHHIISDGWSDVIVFNDLMTLYQSYSKSLPNPLPELKIHYKDYSAWLNKQLNGNRLQKHKDYWKKKFSGEIPTLNLPSFKRRPSLQTFNGKVLNHKMSAEEKNALEKITKRGNVSMLTALMTLLKVVFYKYTNQTDIILGTTLADRLEKELEDQVGLYINTLPVRTVFSQKESFLSLLTRVKEEIFNAMEHRLYPFDQLVDDLNIKPDLGRSALFDVLVEVLSFDDSIYRYSNNNIESNNLKIHPIDIHYDTSLYDLTIYITQNTEDLTFTIRYNTDLFLERQMEFLVKHFLELLNYVAKNPYESIGDISIVTNEDMEYFQLFNGNDKEIPIFKTIPQLIHECALSNLERTAIKCNKQEKTYDEVLKRSNEIAGLLNANGVEEGDVVAILMERSIEMVEVIIGIWKAGAAYLPLDTNHPYERIRYITKSACAPFLIFSKEYLKEGNQLQWDCDNVKGILCIDTYKFHEEEETVRASMKPAIWKYIVEKAGDSIEAGMWYNSFTGKPYSKEEMDEYVENTYRKLRPYLHDKIRILEIGCSSGLTMFRLAPLIKEYVGIDLCKEVLEKNKKVINQEGITNIKLYNMYAHEIDELTEKDFDIIILNSVIQNFNGHNYLKKVVSKIIDISNQEAIIYFGDIMDQDKKTEFLEELHYYKKLHDQDARTWTDWSEYLFVSKKYFEDLMAFFPRFKKVEHTNKYHTMENEMTKYRFDTIAFLKGENSQDTQINLHKKQFDLNDLKQYETSPVINKAIPEGLAYVIYTSGSTGMPKGVMIKHIGMLNHIFSKINDLGITKDSIVAQNSSQCFDISVWQFFTALVTGGKTCIYSNDLIMNPLKFIHALRDDQITILEVVPSYLVSLLDMIDDFEKPEELFHDLKYLLVTGEEIKPNLVNRWLKLYSNISLVNAYGPTEASDDITHHFISELVDDDQVPIGKPIQNMKIYIVDENKHLCPIGVQGEICVAGIGVGNGYLNDPDTTAQKFIKNPFDITKKELLYKTGDLGRWRFDGTIDYFGRKDNQVKVRGYRIELGEIEKKITSYDKVKEAAVIVSQDEKDKNIYAFVTTKEGFEIDDLVVYLMGILPEYMIPQRIEKLEAIPLTSNGKINYKALSSIKQDNGNIKHYVAPRNKIEKKLVFIWEEVLGLKSIGIEDDFFENGGHSLKATNLVYKMYKEFGVEIPLKEVFEKRTIKGLAKYIKEKGVKDYEKILNLEEKQFYDLSSAQKRIFLIGKIEDIGLSYNVPYGLKIKGKFKKEKIQSVFDKLAQRHEALRTSFHIVNSKIMQKIDPKINIEIKNCSLENHQEHIIQQYIDEFIRPFDLAKAPLLRLMILELSQEQSILLFDIHHIISDGLSMNILIREFCDLYNHEEFHLPPLKVQYKDFAAWQNKLLVSEDMKKQKEYWKSVFKDEIKVLNMPLDFKRPKRQSFEGDRYVFETQDDLNKKLYQLSKQTGTTLFMLLLSAFNVLLHKITGDEDVILGSPIAGRQHPDTEHIMGVFINVLSLRNYPKGDMSFNDFLTEVKKNTLNAYENGDFPFEQLVEQLNLPRDLSRNPIFDHMFVLQNMDNQELLLDDLSIEPYPINSNVSQFELKLEVIEKKDKLIYTFEYCTKLFKEETIKRFAESFNSILEQITRNKEVKLSDINILTEFDKKVIEESNNTDVEYNSIGTINKQFESKVETFGDKVAIISNGEELTYYQLNERANKLANLLIREGLKIGEPVVLMVNRGVQTIIGILGIIKAGGVYVPLDPDYPFERVAYVLNHSGAKVLITEGKLLKRIDENFNVDIIVDITANKIEIQDKKKTFGISDIKAQEKDNPNIKYSDESLMYIIYTSGSTGLPKGVMVTHGNVSNFINWGTEKFGLNIEDSMMLVTSISFDISVFEIFGSLLSGATLHIISKGMLQEPQELIYYMDKNKITIWHSVPTLMKQLLIKLSVIDRSYLNTFLNMRLIMIGGEAWSIALATEIRSTFNNASIVNLYGPTEATIWVTSFTIDDNMDSLISIPIGKPIANNKIHILDKYNKLCSVGVPGEIFISGLNVTKGYFKDLEKNKEAFILSNGELMYKTGDFGRYLPDGNIEFHGRKDGMVKVRGYRIEIQEIEKAMLENDKIIETAVVVRKEGETNNLYCYYVANEKLEEGQLKNYLSNKLPDYMIPSRFLWTTSLPTTPNGKVDRKSLVEDISLSLNNKREFEGAKSDLEFKIVTIWQNVLDAKKIGVTDDFFEIGGNSLLAIKLDVELEKNGFNYSGKNVFEYRTVRNYIQLLSGELEINLEDEIDKRHSIISKAPNDKNKSKVIEGIRPFNDIYYKNCFYNSAFPIVKYYNKDVAFFLINEIASYTIRKEEDLEVVDILYNSYNSINRVLDEVGIGYNSKFSSENIIEDIIGSITNNRPVIIWVDCFYESIREEMYNKTHWPHTWLIYGYDEEKQVFNIIEHLHKDNLFYKEMEISFDDLLNSYNGYKENFLNDIHEDSFYEFYNLHEEKKDYRTKSILREITNKNENIYVNQINILERVTLIYENIILKQHLTIKQANEILIGLNNIINAKNVEIYKMQSIYSNSDNLIILLKEIIDKWNFIRSVIAKFIFSSIYKDSSFKKAMGEMREIVELEKKYYCELINSFTHIIPL